MPQAAGHPPQQRIEWIDYAKGIGIFLVVLGHVLRGLGASVGQGYQPELRAMDQWIYAFHMPLFFLLSGLFADRAVSKPPRRFLIDRFQKILYPYFLWSALWAHSAFSQAKTKERPCSNFSRILDDDLLPH